MKKFMKAIAFVTVMCMALSTVAFAAVTAEDDNFDKVVNVTVTGAADSEPVALYIVEEGEAITTAPLYIDQKNANSAGVATFTAPIAEEGVTAVDVYVGYATYANVHSAPEKFSSVKIVDDSTNITIQKTTSMQTVKAEVESGVAVEATFDVDVPEGMSATKMIWSIRYTGGEKTVAYTEAVDATGYGIGPAMEGPITLGLALLTGNDRLTELPQITITSVDAIFLFVDAEGNETEVYTNREADEANKAE